jgi:hypothetical protein
MSTRRMPRSSVRFTHRTYTGLRFNAYTWAVITTLWSVIITHYIPLRCYWWSVMVILNPVRTFTWLHYSLWLSLVIRHCNFSYVAHKYDVTCLGLPSLFRVPAESAPRIIRFHSNPCANRCGRPQSQTILDGCRGCRRREWLLGDV